MSEIDAIIVIFAIVVAVLFLLPEDSAASQKKPAYNGSIHFLLDGLPTPESCPAYHAPVRTGDIASEPDIRHCPSARPYLYELRRALRQGYADCNGIFRVVDVRCRDMRRYFLMNMTDGTVSQIPGEGKGCIRSPESCLIITGYPDEAYERHKEQAVLRNPKETVAIRFYTVGQGGALQKIRVVSSEGLNMGCTSVV